MNLEHLGFKLNDQGQWIRNHQVLPEVIGLMAIPDAMEITPEFFLVKTTDGLTEDEVSHLLKRLDLPFLELLIQDEDELDNQDFFSKVPEKYWHLNELLPYIKPMEKLGLIFDLDLASKEDNQEFMAIDCGDYIKFISVDNYNIEKKARQIVQELSEQTSYPEVMDWLDNIYYRHLLSNEFNSNEIHHILDWLNHPSTDRSVTQKSLSVDRAKAKSERWVELENEKQGIKSLKDTEGVDVVTITTAGDYQMVKLVSPDSKKRESKKMHNCIGTVHINSSSLYSVRRNGIRVASIDLRDDKIKECKGPWNKSVQKQHQQGVINCLNNLKVNWLDSYDIGNLSLKVFKISVSTRQIPILVDESSSLYFQTSSVLDLGKFLDGVKFSEKEQEHQKVLKLIPDEFKDEVRAKLYTVDFEDYLVCPLTKRMVNKAQEYYKIVGDLERMLDKVSPELVSRIAEKMENNWTNSKVAMGRQTFLRQAIEQELAVKPEFEKTISNTDEYRKFLWDLSILVDGKFYQTQKLVHHVGHFKSIFPDVTNKEGLLEKLTSYNRNISNLRELVPALNKITKLSPIEISGELKASKIYEAEDCKECSNLDRSKAQLSLMEEMDYLLKETLEVEVETNELLEKIKPVAEEALEMIEMLSQLVLRLGFFDFVKGKVKQPSISEYRSILSRIDEIIETLENFKVSEDLDEWSQKINDNTDLISKNERQMDRLAKEFERISGQDCEECNGEEDVNANSYQLESFNFSYDWDLTRAKWEAIIEAQYEIKQIINDPKQIKRDLMEFFYLKS